MTEKTGESDYVREQVSSLKERLIAYEEGIGLRTRTDYFHVEGYLQLTKEQLRKTPYEECGYISFELAQFALHVQKQINVELAVVNFCREAIKRTIANDLPQIKSYHYEEKKMLAIRHNAHADQLHKIEIQAQARVDKLSFITDKIKLMVKQLENIQYSKKGIKYEQE